MYRVLQLNCIADQVLIEKQSCNYMNISITKEKLIGRGFKERGDFRVLETPYEDLRVYCYADQWLIREDPVVGFDSRVFHMYQIDKILAKKDKLWKRLIL